MDRVVALSAVLVGVLSLLGTVLVSTHNGIETQRLASEIAQLRTAISLQNGSAAEDVASVAVPVASSSSSEQQVADLESSAPPVSVPPPPSLQLPASSSASALDPDLGRMEPPAPLVPLQPSASSAAQASGARAPADDCIPVGTRFMATKGDSFPICNMQVTVKVGAVSQSIVNVDGIGTLPAGGLAKIGGGKCTLNVFSADATGYAEFKVTCP